MKNIENVGNICMLAARREAEAQVFHLFLGAAEKEVDAFDSVAEESAPKCDNKWLLLRSQKCGYS